ncbi:MAG: hypothetical protein KDC44_19690 [Phaeodactylibacter sp.]|nr:hypothetical protein [Phaeodactylibacter sp.]
MPIEIRELVIKATVNQSIGASNNASLTPEDLQRLQRDIIKECVETVLEKVEQKNNR